MLNKTIILILILLKTCSLLAAESRTLIIGSPTALPAGKHANIKVSRDGVIDIQEADTELILTGIAPGQVDVTIDGFKYNIHVVGKGSVRLLKAFQNFLKDKMGLRAQSLSGKIVVTGECRRQSDWLGLVEIAKRENLPFEFAAQWDSDQLPAVQAELRQAFSAVSHLQPYLQTGPPHIIGFPKSELSQQQTLSRIAGFYGLQIQFQEQLLDTALSVRVHATIAEISHRAQKEIGLNWPQSYHAQITPQFTNAEEIFVTLKAMEDKGYGQILASPSLMAKSGAEAEFLAGGEFPIKVSSRGVREVHWKKHGILLKIRPMADRAGRISLDVLTEVSLIDGATLIEGIPGLKTNRMNTKIDLNKPGTIILSGLLRQDQHENQSGLPVLQNIPVLGRLFRSDNYVRMKSELVIFLTPEILTTTENTQPPTVPKSWRSFDEIE